MTSTGASPNIVESGSGNVVTGISATGGTVTVTKGSIAATDYIKNGTNALDLTMGTGESKDSMAPSITAIEGMKTTSVAAANSASDNKVPTEAAVRTAVDGITSQFEAEVADNILSLQGQAFDDADAVAHNTIADRADPNLIPRNYDIQKGVAYLKGTGIKNMTANVVNTNAENVGIKNETVANTAKTSWDTNILRDAHGDEFVPTVAAVEARVQRAESAASSNLASAKDETQSATWDSSTHTLTLVTTADAAGNKTDKLATTNQVRKTASALNDRITYEVGEKVTKNDAITARNNSIVNYDAKGLVTGGVVFEDASGGLTGVNGETAGNMNCSTTNPCVLTYLGGTGSNARYRWTAMDTENVTAQ